MTARSAVRVSAREARSIRVNASCAAIASAGPTGKPARRSRRAKCMTFAARVRPDEGRAETMAGEQDPSGAQGARGRALYPANAAQTAAAAFWGPTFGLNTGRARGPGTH